MSTTENRTQEPHSGTGSRSWRREPYVWLLIFIPAMALIAGAITVFLAVHGADIELPHSP